MRRVVLWLIMCLLVVSGVRGQDDARLLTPEQPTSGVIDADHLLRLYTVVAPLASQQVVHLRNTGAAALSVTLGDSAGSPLDVLPPIVPGAQGDVRWLAAGGTTYYLVVSPAEVQIDPHGQFTLSLTSAPLDTPYALQFFLSWEAEANLSLEIRDPFGQVLDAQNRQTTGGGTFSGDAPLDCAATTPQLQTRMADWLPDNIPAGSYEIRVRAVDSCADSVPFRVEILLRNQTFKPFSAAIRPGETFVSGFTVADDGSGAASEHSGFVAANPTITIPTADLVANAQPLPADGIAHGHIGNDIPFRNYRFEGELGDLVSGTVTRTAGTLDIVLALLDTNGNLLVMSGGETGATFDRARLRHRGSYLIVVTRYGQLFGATEGDFELMVS